MNVEFVDEAPHSDDVLDVGGSTRRTPPWLTGALIALAAALAIVVVVVQRQPSAKVRPVAAPTSARPPILNKTAESIYRRARAVSPPETGPTAASTCETVRVATAPPLSAFAALGSGLPAYTSQLDTSEVTGEYGGLCSVQVRARDSAGTVAVLVVTAPAAATAARESATPNVIQSQVTFVHSLAVEYVRFTTTDGWTVVAGTVGPASDRPSTALLGNVAVSPALRW